MRFERACKVRFKTHYPASSMLLLYAHHFKSASNSFFGPHYQKISFLAVLAVDFRICIFRTCIGNIWREKVACREVNAAEHFAWAVGCRRAFFFRYTELISWHKQRHSAHKLYYCKQPDCCIYGVASCIIKFRPIK